MDRDNTSFLLSTSKPLLAIDTVALMEEYQNFTRQRIVTNLSHGIVVTIRTTMCQFRNIHNEKPKYQSILKADNISTYLTQPQRLKMKIIILTHITYASNKK